MDRTGKSYIFNQKQGRNHEDTDTLESPKKIQSIYKKLSNLQCLSRTKINGRFRWYGLVSVVWFDVKSTKNKTSFPFANISKHQIDYLEKVAIQGGKAFFLIHSEVFKKTWLLWIDQFFNFTGETERKSVPFAWLDANCEIVPKGHGIVLDYLPLVLKRKEAET